MLWTSVAALPSMKQNFMFARYSHCETFPSRAINWRWANYMTLILPLLQHTGVVSCCPVINDNYSRWVADIMTSTIHWPVMSKWYDRYQDFLITPRTSQYTWELQVCWGVGEELGTLFLQAGWAASVSDIDGTALILSLCIYDLFKPELLWDFFHAFVGKY